MRRIAPTILLAALLLPSGGCLITDPILPMDGSTPQMPEFLPGRPQPDPSSTVSITNDATLVTFDASSRDTGDGAIPLDQLQYDWDLDGSSASSGVDAHSFSTSGSVLGLGAHTLHVRVTDGSPTGFVEATWNIDVHN